MLPELAHWKRALRVAQAAGLRVLAASLPPVLMVLSSCIRDDDAVNNFRGNWLAKKTVAREKKSIPENVEWVCA
jgi:hypothetical protein